MKASVIIPTKNAGPIFSKVLDAVLQQCTPWEYEVLVVDSGSTDGTVEYARSKPEVMTLEIPPAEFGHGKTRNLGIQNTKGQFAVLITHDAQPADEHWLANLVAAAEANDMVAGAFGRHVAYDQASPFTKRDLKAHFDNFAAMPRIMRLEDTERYKNDVGYRQVLHFFSSNNACIRRSVWEEIPLPDVDFAEDQNWAKMIIEAGYSKAYADDAIVCHSHDFGPWETGRRCFDEAFAFNKYFGYDLCPSITYFAAQFARTSLIDIKYILGEKGNMRSLYWGVTTPFRNFFRQLGYFLGQRASSLPEWFVNSYSRDKALYRKL